MARRIVKAKIKYISLVPKGANRMPVIFKADDNDESKGTLDLDMLFKSDDAAVADKGEIHAIVYAPEHRDSQGDIASAVVIKEAAYNYMRSGGQIDIRHDETAITKDKAYVAESFIVHKGDERFDGILDSDGKAVDPVGSWGVVIKIDDPELRKLYREGKWRGVSMGGMAEVKAEKSDDVADRILAALRNKLNPNNVSIYGSISMTGEELIIALNKQAETIIKGVAEAIKPAAAPVTKADEPKPAEALVFKGEPTAENLRKFRLEVRKAAIIASIDATKPETIEKAETDLAALEAETTKKSDTADDAEAGIEKDDSDEVKSLKRQLAKVQKSSSQPAGAAKDEPTGCVGLTKEEAEELNYGHQQGVAVNKIRGFDK